MSRAIDMTNFNGRRKAGVDYSVALRDLLPGLIGEGCTPKSKKDIAAATGRNVETITRLFQKIRGEIYIADWRRGRSGVPTALWLFGTEKDEPIPKAFTSAEKSQRYRDSGKGSRSKKSAVALMRESEAYDGIDPPSGFLTSGTRILVWRALAHGQTLNRHDIERRYKCHTSTAVKIMRLLLDSKKVHIVDWCSESGKGLKMPVIAFGPGKDAPPPKRESNAALCRRWRKNNPEARRLSEHRHKLKVAAKNGTMPRGNDELLFKIMGIAA